MAHQKNKNDKIKSKQLVLPNFKVKPWDGAIIYHNPKCSTSRNTILRLKQLKQNIMIIEYLKEAPTIAELKALLQKLGLKAEQIVRKKEALYKEKYADKKISETQWLKILFSNPVLIERPIVVFGNKAIIPRPIEKLNELFK